MAELDVYIESKLLDEISKLAIKHCGNDSEESHRLVIETALEMRTLWSYSIKKVQEETDEAVSKWEFLESPVSGENGDKISGWLFRR